MKTCLSSKRKINVFEIKKKLKISFVMIKLKRKNLKNINHKFFNLQL